MIFPTSTRNGIRFALMSRAPAARCASTSPVRHPGVPRAGAPALVWAPIPTRFGCIHPELVRMPSSHGLALKHMRRCRAIRIGRTSNSPRFELVWNGGLC